MSQPYLSPPELVRLLAGRLAHEIRCPDDDRATMALRDIRALLSLNDDAVDRMELAMADDFDDGLPVHPTENTSQVVIDVPTATKGDGYVLQTALEAPEGDGTFTRQHDKTAGSYVTTLSVDDTKGILRGEPADSFPPQFVERKLGNTFGRPILEWTEAGDRLVVMHL